MSFDTYERSTEQSQPSELYEFVTGGGTYRYTSAADTVVISGVPYAQQAGLSRSSIEDAGDIYKSALTVTAPEDFPVSLLFEVYPPSDVVTLKVQRVQLADLTDVKAIWLGRILNVGWQPGRSTLTLESLFSSLKHPGLRRIYSRSCPYLVYGPECKADVLAFQELAPLNAMSVDRFSISSATFAGHPNGYYTGGKLSFDAGGGIVAKRGIRAHVGDTITMTHPIAELTAGSSVTINPGCDHTAATCKSRFNNKLRYGGFEYVPKINPYTNSVF